MLLNKIIILILCFCIISCNQLKQTENKAVGFESVHVIEYNSIEFLVCNINPKDYKLKVVSDVESGVNRIETLGDSLHDEGRQLLFATNGGIFSKSYKPGGLFINNGKEINPINTRKGAGNFHLMPNGIFYIDKNGNGQVRETHGFIEQNEKDIAIAVQSGPMLVIDNALHPAFNEGSNNTYIRNGIGVDDEGNLVFAISKSRTNLHTFASLFKNELQCKNALYLDGAISEMYIHQLSKEHEIRRKFATIFYLDSDLE